jgi:hypothetical protein
MVGWRNQPPQCLHVLLQENVKKRLYLALAGFRQKVKSYKKS